MTSRLLAGLVALGFAPVAVAQQPKVELREIRASLAKSADLNFVAETAVEKARVSLLEKVKAATARVTCADGTVGAGVLIDLGDGTKQYVLTCEHVARPDAMVARKASFNVTGETGFDCTPVLTSKSADLCVLKLSRPVKAAAVVPLKLAAKPPVAAHDYLLVGHPTQQLTWYPRFGQFEKVLTGDDLGGWPEAKRPLRAGAAAKAGEPLLYTLSAATELVGGFSGAAVVNNDGEVAGVLTGRLHEVGDKKFALAVAVAEIRRLLDNQLASIDLTKLPVKLTADPPPLTVPDLPRPPAPPPVNPRDPTFTKTVQNAWPGLNYDGVFALVTGHKFPDGGPDVPMFENGRGPFLGKSKPAASVGLKVATKFGLSYTAPATAGLREIHDAKTGLFAHELVQDGAAGVTTRMVSIPVARSPASRQSVDGLLDALNGSLLNARRNLLRLHAPGFDGPNAPANANGSVALGVLHETAPWGDTFYLSDLSTVWTYRHYTDAAAGKDWVVLYDLHGDRFTVTWFEAPSTDLKTEAGRAKHANKGIVLFSQSVAPGR